MKGKKFMDKAKVLQIIVKNGFYIGDITLSCQQSTRRMGTSWFQRGVYVDPITQAPFAMVDTADGNGSFYGSTVAGLCC